MKQNGHEIYSLDFRSKIKNDSFEIIVNGEASILDIQSTKNLGSSEDLVIVTTKSFCIDRVMIEKLIQSDKEIIFLQNGISQYNSLHSLSDNFNFGSIAGIQAFLNNDKVIAKTDNCHIMIKVGKNNRLVSTLPQPANSNCVINIFDNFNELMLNKFIRWLVVSIITSLAGQPLGRTLRIFPFAEIINGIDEILKFINLEFGTNIRSSDIYNSLVALPSDLKTSSFRDYALKGENEMTHELRYVLDSLEDLALNSSTLRKWEIGLANGA